MRIILIILVIILAVIYTFSKTKYVQEKYIVLETINNIEIRKYESSVNAIYYSKDDKERNYYFRILASYIFGENSKNESISMTSPVTMRLHGNKEMLFRMPDKYTLENLPKANNTDIKFTKISSCIKAAIKYSGYSNNKIEQKKITELKEILQAKNISHDSKFEILVYNSPYKVLNRRNEITVNVTYP